MNNEIFFLISADHYKYTCTVYIAKKKQVKGVSRKLLTYELSITF